MPNHVTNILSIETLDDDRVKEILERICYDGKIGTIDFEKIIPIPDNIYRGNIGSKEHEKYGENNWYDFCRKNWGTKWNSYNSEYHVDYEEGCNTIIFDTAWSAPQKVIMKLSSMFPDVELKHKWADEDFGVNCGYCRLKEGCIIELYTPLPCSDEANKFAASVLGYESCLEPDDSMDEITQ